MLTKQDKQYLKETFATKDDLKAFPTKDDTQTFIRVELARNEPELIRKIRDKVTETLGEKIDKMSTKLDSL